jgi:hypothetical protein
VLYDVTVQKTTICISLSVVHLLTLSIGQALHKVKVQGNLFSVTQPTKVSLAGIFQALGMQIIVLLQHNLYFKLLLRVLLWFIIISFFRPSVHTMPILTRANQVLFITQSSCISSRFFESIDLSGKSWYVLVFTVNLQRYNIKYFFILYSAHYPRSHRAHSRYHTEHPTYIHTHIPHTYTHRPSH